MTDRRRSPALAKCLGALLVISLLGLTACSTTPPGGMNSVTPFDLSHYEERWYELARLDHSFERDLSVMSVPLTGLRPMAASR